MNSANFSFFFVLLKIYGSQSQVQKKLTLNYGFMRSNQECESKYATILLYWLATGHLPFTKLKLHVHQKKFLLSSQKNKRRHSPINRLFLTFKHPVDAKTRHQEDSKHSQAGYTTATSLSKSVDPIFVLQVSLFATLQFGQRCKVSFPLNVTVLNLV